MAMKLSLLLASSKLYTIIERPHLKQNFRMIAHKIEDNNGSSPAWANEIPWIPRDKAIRIRSDWLETTRIYSTYKLLRLTHMQKLMVDPMSGICTVSIGRLLMTCSGRVFWQIRPQALRAAPENRSWFSVWSNSDLREMPFSAQLIALVVRVLPLCLFDLELTILSRKKWSSWKHSCSKRYWIRPPV